MATLKLDSICFSVSGCKILNNICFEINGGINAICGSNGSGKTCLLKIIKGLFKQDKGTVFIDNIDVSKKLSQRMNRVGLVFQDADVQIVGETVEKDVAFGPENLGWEKEKIENVTQSVIQNLGMQNYRKKRPAVLSGGEKRCLAIAGVFAMEPSVILLDEPFANLDFSSVCLVLKAILNLKKRGVTVIIVSHETDKFLSYADKTLVLDGGNQVYFGDTLSAIPVMKKHGIHVPDLPLDKMKWL